MEICDDINEIICKKVKIMGIIEYFKNLINRLEEIDIKSKRMSKEKCYSSNPFAFTQNKTYAWVEKVKDFNKCSRRNRKN